MGELVEIGAGWDKIGKNGKRFTSLSIGDGKRAMMFPNTQKKSEKQPDYRIMSDDPELVAQFGREKSAPAKDEQPRGNPVAGMDDVPF
jgi:uncharacterized protein (DUF736 family)